MKGCIVACVGLTLLYPAPGEVSGRRPENVRALITALKSPDKEVRRRAAITLGRMGPKAKAAVPALARALKDAEPEVRRAAVEALVDIDSRHPAVLPGLLAALKDPNEEVRWSAVSALVSAGRRNRQVIPAVTELMLKDRDWQARLLAVEVVAEIDPGNKHILPALIEALKSKDKEVRQSAHSFLMRLEPNKVLEKFGAAARPTVPALVKLLKHEDPLVREAAARALGHAGPAAGSAVPALVGALKDREKDVRRQAAASLGRSGPAAKRAIPALIEALKHHEDVDLRFIARDALAEIGPVAVPALTELLKDKSVKEEPILVRSHAAVALGKVGSRAKEAVPLLEQALKDRRTFPRGYESERLEYAEALWKIDPGNKLTVPVAVEVLTDEGLSREKDLIATWARERAIKMLGEIGPRAKAAVPALTEALKDREGTVRGLAATALGKLGPHARASVPALVAALKDENGYVRIDAAEALVKVAPGRRKTAVAALVDTLKEQGDNLYVYLKAAEALQRLDPDHAAVVPALVRVAKNKDEFLFWEERRRAVKTLGKMGPKARAGVPALLSILEGETPERDADLGFLRLEAIKALNRIGLDKSAVRPLVKALKDQSSFLGGFPGAEVRREAAEALGKLGPAARAAVPALTDALTDKYKPVREAAAKALDRLQARE